LVKDEPNTTRARKRPGCLANRQGLHPRIDILLFPPSLVLDDSSTQFDRMKREL